GRAAAGLFEGDAKGRVARPLLADDRALHRSAVAPRAEAGELARRRGAGLLVVEGAVGVERRARARRAGRERDARAAAVLARELHADGAEELLGRLDPH